jgi:predicted RNA polymerase sigma factor
MRRLCWVNHDDPPEPPGAIDDERLRLIVTCCHPALALQTRVALTLRMVAGLTVPGIARAYHAARADLLRRLGRGQQSRAAYDQAIEPAGNTAESAYLTRRHDQLG